jgi:CSLREA domain-containing protein
MPRWSAFVATAVLAAAPLGAVNIFVDTTADTEAADGFCSLREAIAAANADASTSECAAGTGTSDRILFDLATPATIALTDHLPEITESVALVGPGVDDLEIDGGDLYRLIRFYGLVESDPWLLISGLTLTDGLADAGAPGGAVQATGNVVLRDCELSSSRSTWYAGGLWIDGSATVERCRILFNSADGPVGGGGIYVYDGGRLTLVASTVAGNSTPGENAYGGGILADSPDEIFILRSTISGNSVGGAGGGLMLGRLGSAPASTVTIESSTIAGNQCGVGNATDVACGGGMRLFTNLDGLMNASLRNSVVALNVDATASAIAHDVLLESDPGLTFESLGFNLIGDNRGATGAFAVGAPNGENDLVGDGTTPIDPDLDVLAFYGGPTPTRRPASLASPLLDNGTCMFDEADQRGFGNAATGMRIVDALPGGLDDDCDIGAFEASAVALVASQIFLDGFESGLLLFWSADEP